MNLKRQARTAWVLLLITPFLFISCTVRTPQKPVRAAGVPTVLSSVKMENVTPLVELTPTQGQTPDPTRAVTSTVLANQPAVQADPVVYSQPAGCQSFEEEIATSTVADRLARADEMLGLDQPLSQRILPRNWNAFTRSFSDHAGDVLSLNVENVQAKYLIQKMMNALQVSGFITWLRRTPQQGLHILAIPVRGSWLNSTWGPYVRAYWESNGSVPDGDPAVIPVLKLPPCRWMGKYGYPETVGTDWWLSNPPQFPNYVEAAAAYLAETNDAAIQVARRIDWLGADGREGPNTMCGPLAWSILNDAGAFPPGWGGWSEGSKSFWLAKPRTNGRPWSLFPSGSYHVYAFREPLSKFDFGKFPLYPGDFIYSYSEGNGFDHMLVVTEVDGEGNVYTVTNRVQVAPQKITTIERMLLLNLQDPSAGIARNQWENDRVNGRTGHAGFDVFRWAWMEKDILAQPVSYTIQVGDTIPLIALKWKTPAEWIARYNGMTLDATLAVGQELQIPPNERTGLR